MADGKKDKEEIKSEIVESSDAVPEPQAAELPTDITVSETPIVIIDGVDSRTA